MGWIACVELLACQQPSNQDSKGKPEAPPHAVTAAPTPLSASPVAPAASLGSPGVAPVPRSSRVIETAAIVASTTEAPPLSRCNEQKPQQFLVQAHFDSFNASGGSPLEWQQVLKRAVRYRTEQYGYVKGYGNKAWHESTPLDQATAVTFFGVPVSIHRRIAPALSCVETAIRERCTAEPYQPYVLSGLRRRNTYLNGEISNHVYGIAIDVDPTRNPCCGCVGEWRTSERCQNEKTKFQRMDMPRCWVTEFERFGFYWLGHEKIEDTMHFEFLADPSQITRQAALAP